MRFPGRRFAAQMMGGTPPAVPVLTAPVAADAMIYSGKSITLSATSTDGDLDSMKWIATPSGGGAETELASDAAAPYSQTYTMGLATGIYDLVARATRGGLTTDSTVLTIYVFPANITVWRRGDDHATGALVALIDRGPAGLGATGTATCVAAVLDGHKSIRFNGSTDGMATAAVDWTGKTDFTVLAVMNPTVTGTQVFLEKGVAVTEDFSIADATGTLYFTSKHSGSARDARDKNPSPADGTFKIYEYTLTQANAAGSEIEAWIDGATQTLGGAGVDSSGGLGNTAFYEGARSGGLFPAVFDYVELLIFDSALSSGTRDVIRAGLQALYPSLP